MTAQPVRLLLVDDHHVVRQGLAALLREVPSFEVAGEAATAAEALSQTRRLRPDVILMDVRLADGTGIDACRDVRAEFPDTKVIMLTSYGEEEAIVASVAAGASGYLLKRVDAEQLIAAIQKVASGMSLLDPEIHNAVVAWMRRTAQGSEPDPLAELSPQEHSILALVAEGGTNREIGEKLALSPHTVKGYVSSILHKLSYTRRSELAAFVARQRSSFPHPS